MSDFTRAIVIKLCWNDILERVHGLSARIASAQSDQVRDAFNLAADIFAGAIGGYPITFETMRDEIAAYTAENGPLTLDKMWTFPVPLAVKFFDTDAEMVMWKLQNADDYIIILAPELELVQ